MLSASFALLFSCRFVGLLRCPLLLMTDVLFFCWAAASSSCFNRRPLSAARALLSTGFKGQRAVDQTIGDYSAGVEIKTISFDYR